MQAVDCSFLGIEVLMKISEAFCDNDNRPYQDIRITHTVILDDPFDDPDGKKLFQMWLVCNDATIYL